MSPEQADGRLDQLGPGQRRLQPGGDALYPAGRPAAVRLRLVRRHGDAGPGPAERVPAAAEGQPARPPALEAVCLKAMAEPAGGPVRLGHGAGRGDRALAGRRAGARPPRAGAGAAGPVGPAAQADRRRRRRAAADRRGRPVRRHPPGRPRAAADRGAAAAGRGAATPRLPQVGGGHRRAEALRRRDAVSRVNLAYREYLDDNVALADELLDGCPGDLRGLGVGLRPPAGPLRAEELDRVEPAAWTSGAWRSRPTGRGSRPARGRGAGWATDRPASWSSATSTPAPRRSRCAG